MPQNLADNFFGLTVWVVYVVSKANSEIRAVIRNTTDGTEWDCKDWARTTEVHSWVHYIGIPISMKSEDKIEVSFEGVEDECVNVEKCGIHLVYKPDIT